MRCSVPRLTINRNSGDTRATLAARPMIWLPPRRPPSAHFTWAEVIAHSGYSRVPLGPLRLPNGKWVTPRANARTQARLMEQVRDEVNYLRSARLLRPTGINVLSWARSWDHNIAVGGAKDSQHL